MSKSQPKRIMQHQICNLFCQPVTLISINIDGVVDFFEKVIKKNNPKEFLNSASNTNLANYHNDENIFEIYDELKSLEKDILAACNFVYQDILNYDSDLKITNAWINECQIRGGQEYHNHCNSIISGTVYLRTDENTNIIFLNRHIMSDTVAQLNDVPNQEKNNKYGYYYHSDMAKFNVQAGDCLIWPSYLRHGYKDNQTPNRLSLSFNTIPTKLNSLYKL